MFSCRCVAPTLAILLGLGGCVGPVHQPQDGRLRIVTTTGPVGDLVRNVVGDLADVETLMGPGVDPHLYRELPADTEKLSGADAIFYNGLHLEGRMGDTLAKLGRKKPVCAVAGKLEETHDPRLLTPPGFAGHPDPHVWHDVALWSDCVPTVVEAMSQVDSEHAAAYKQNGDAFQEKLAKLDEECREQLAQIPPERRVLVTAHDAFAYFSRAYGLEAVGLKGISTEEEIDLEHMQEVIHLVIDRRVPCVFVESAVAPRIMEALAEPCRADGHNVLVPSEESQQLYADALGKPGSGAETYIGMIRENVRNITAGLTGQLAKEATTP